MTMTEKTYTESELQQAVQDELDRRETEQLRRKVENSTWDSKNSCSRIDRASRIGGVFWTLPLSLALLAYSPASFTIAAIAYVFLEIFVFGKLDEKAVQRELNYRQQQASKQN